MSAALELERVSIRLGGRQVVDEVTVDLGRGEWTVVIGPNGAGKTTLLRALAGLVRHDGAIRLHGRPVSGLHRRELAKLVAVVAQEPATPPWLTVAEYVLLGRTPYVGFLAQESRADLDAALRALERLDLLPYADRALGTLSGGEKQRAVVARALAQEASVVLLDEPTSALDIGHQQQALELLDWLRGEAGLTLVAAMHDLTVAGQYADRVLLLDGGRLVADGTPAEVFTEERLSRHYAAAVEVVELEGRLAVVPRRTRAAREEETWER
jgi:iron complex transport system ATP-binding protein